MGYGMNRWSTIPWSEQAYNTQPFAGNITSERQPAQQPIMPLAQQQYTMPTNKAPWLTGDYTAMAPQGVNWDTWYASAQKNAQTANAIQMAVASALLAPIIAPGALAGEAGAINLGGIGAEGEAAQGVEQAAPQAGNWLSRALDWISRTGPVSSKTGAQMIPTTAKIAAPLAAGGLAHYSYTGTANPLTWSKPSGVTTPTETAKVGDTRVATGGSGEALYDNNNQPIMETWDGTNWVRSTATTPTKPTATLPAGYEWTLNATTNTWEVTASSGTSVTDYGQPQTFTDPTTGQRFYWDASSGGWQPISTSSSLSLADQEALYAQQAAEQQAQTYAADPYKYWAQLGSPTPEAVARLTGGQVQSGAQMGKVPLSIPSEQWWANLLPSEQQQIYGAINWLGTNPADYQEMQNRMIPGLGQRQVQAQWAQ